MSVSNIGPIVQIAYLVRDIDAEIAHWVNLGVGPFFLTRHPRYVEQSYRGNRIECDISAAFAYSGDVQIELIQQHDGLPSAFTEFIAAHGFGMHHVGILSNDIAEDTASLAVAGFAPFHRMLSATGVETIFFETELQGGTVLELIHASPAVIDGFARIKAAAQTWDRVGPAVIEF